MQVTEHSVKMIQIDGTKRQVYIKFMDDEYVQDIKDDKRICRLYTRNRRDFPGTHKHCRNGYPSRQNRLSTHRSTRRTIRATLAQYGEIKTTQDETWFKAYRYPVANGIKVITINLTQHLPSHMAINGTRVLTYDGQPLTCYGCGETGHMYQVCPSRHGASKETTSMTGTTWAQITVNGPHH